jgi:uncharacterized protein YciI
VSRWVAIFEDDPARQGVRASHADVHFDYLAAHGDRIRVGGGLREDPAGPFVGGLWVIEAATREEAAQLCEADPYFVEGLRKSYRLFVCGRAPCFGTVVI